MADIVPQGTPADRDALRKAIELLDLNRARLRNWWSKYSAFDTGDHIREAIAGMDIVRAKLAPALPFDSVGRHLDALSIQLEYERLEAMPDITAIEEQVEANSRLSAPPLVTLGQGDYRRHVCGGHPAQTGTIVDVMG